MITKGQKINERYEIIRSIGEGGMANVYLGYDTILDRNVAIKILRGDLSTDEKFVRRFQREALSASSLSHPNIVEMYDVGEDGGIYYIVMEYIEGQTLKQLLKKRGNLTLSESIDIMLQLTDGMGHAHDSYIIHRDLKPQNIMIQDDGQIKITDFGIAMALNSTQLTQTNSVIGSVHYLPPEQAAGKGSTIRSDIYSMGIIFYELLTGNLPFKGDNAVEIALKQMKEPLPDLTEDNSSIPMSIENVILKSTAKNPKNRYTDARQMHDDLLTVLDDDRLSEEKYIYPHPEHEENTKSIKKLEDIETKEQVAEKIEEEQEDKMSKRIIIVLASIFLGITLILITLLVIIPSLNETKTIEVPDVRNLTVSKAEKKLQTAGFEVNQEIKEVYDDTIDKNKIVKTSPEAGRSIKEKSKITLYKSKGTKDYNIEDYVGKSYQTAMNKLDNLGVTVNITKVDPDSTTCKYIGKEVIIWQSLANGSKVKKGDTITLKVLNDPTFPNWSGKTQDEVTDWCNENCVTLNVNYQDTTDETLINKVIDQSRPADSKVNNSDSVSITVGRKAKVEDNDKTTTDNKKTEENSSQTNKDTNNQKDSNNNKETPSNQEKRQ